MRGAEGVVITLGAARKSRDATPLPQGGHALAPPGQNLVRVALVADVPDDAVARRVEDVMQRDGELHRAKVGRQMPAGARDGFEDELAQLLRELRQILFAQAPQLRGVVDLLEETVHQWVLATIQSASSARRRAPVPSMDVHDRASERSAAMRSLAAARPSSVTYVD